ncbi:DUF1259 domain-containing protein [Paenibacillus sp. 1-18]|uniref:DUF1259 domain-containing protein n=1 Tax=Paenibacillus sp. 1-18 TaxID=1333846 RepID=UPI000471CC93|nr:DUF1259 domain-containing protein [Paenibacillus sp. 1-18]
MTALHNHWLFDKPNLWYIHFEKVDKKSKHSINARDPLWWIIFFCYGRHIRQYRLILYMSPFIYKGALYEKEINF